MRSASRRDLLRFAASASLFSLFPNSGWAEDTEEQAIPFLDAEKLAPAKGGMLNWNELKDWVIPTKDLYHVSHYGVAQLKEENYKLTIDGLVEKPQTLTLDQIKSKPAQEVTLTLECGGNGNPGFMCAIGNIKLTGTPLAPILRECNLRDEAVEVAFWGADSGTENVRDNQVKQNFSRSLSIKNAFRDDILLCYAMNGQPLTPGHGFPLRLIVPGWYGVAWVKWLTRIEARDRPLMQRFMAKDYVTLRGQQQGDQVVWTQTSVGPMNVKSMVARAVRRKDGTIRFTGAAWSDGTPLKSVELKIDDAAWTPTLLGEQQKHTWTFWIYDWKDAPAGEHTIVSRAIDAKGRVQPSADDPSIKLKKTFWEANQQYPRKIKI
ncbi:MAG TPA: sulfite oxidase [Tepidisphaeraceae bacterium]|jgi:DMSO/TMAO reductase YedYZ molybdopterin-dependent catalytic subunit|nr:sulfite oxidase [Tepidisphaeraceae bacterium]